WYWFSVGSLIHGKPAVDKNHDSLLLLTKSSTASVRIAAARALAEFGTEADAQAAFTVLLNAADWSKNDVFTAMSAVDALNAVGQKAAPYAALIKALPKDGPAPDARYKPYIPRILEELGERFP